MSARYFRHAPSNTWYAGMQQIVGAFADSGAADADRIAAACGLAAGSVVPVTLADADPDPRVPPTFAEAATPVPPLDADDQAIYDFMPASGSAASGAVTAYIGNAANDPATRATMRALRGVIRKMWQKRNT